MAAGSISVLLPFRDAAPTLEEALGSVLAQRGVALEVIAIDDGSRDGGAAIVERLAKRDARITMVASGGVGIARALGLGLARARGSLIGRMDADDISLPGRFLAQAELLAARPDVAVVGTKVEAFGQVGDGLRAYVDWQNSVLSPAEHAAAIFVESPLCHPSVVMRRDALVAVGGFVDGPFPEDYDLWLRLDHARCALAKVDDVLFRWRHRPDRATFRDPRCAPDRIRELRARYLALRLEGRPFAIWGAGKTGRRLARALGAHGLVPELFIDIDPKKIGRVAQDRPILSATRLEDGLVVPFIVVAVGARGARDIVRARLARIGCREGKDYVCAS